MAEEIHITATDKRGKYEEILPQIESLVAGEQDLIANLGNVAAVLRETFGWFWVGFYLVKGEQLVLGPFQGPLACTRIGYGKGVCGASWSQGATIVVPDVEAFPGHISCSSASRSEIVLPIYDRGGKVVAVLDADSSALAEYDATDAEMLEKLAAMLVGQDWAQAG